MAWAAAHRRLALASRLLTWTNSHGLQIVLLYDSCARQARRHELHLTILAAIVLALERIGDRVQRGHTVDDSAVVGHLLILEVQLTR